jgi:hypothetical protein
MTQYQYGKDLIEFYSIVGEVLSPETRQTLQIHSSYGRSSPYELAHFSISSTTEIDTHFWIRLDEDNEYEVYLPSKDINLREGQIVTLTLAKVIKGSRGWIKPTHTHLYVGLFNHNTQRSVQINDALVLRECFHLRHNNLLSTLFHIGVIAGIGFLFPFAGLILAVIYYLFTCPVPYVHEFRDWKFSFDFLNFHIKKAPELNALINDVITPE